MKKIIIFLAVIILILIVYLFMFKNKASKEINNGPAVIKTTHENYDSLPERDRREMEQLKNLLPKSDADTIFIERDKKSKKKE